MIVTGALLFFDKDYLGYFAINVVITVMLVTLGIMFTAAGLRKDEEGSDELAIGSGLVFIWAVFYTTLNIVYVNYLMIFVLLIGSVFMFDGVVKVISTQKKKKNNKANIVGTLLLFLTQAVTIIVGLLRINNLI